MNKKNKVINILKKWILYLIVILISVILAVVGALHSNTDLLEVAFGLLSGALVAFITSLILGVSKENSDDEQWLSLLDGIAQDQLEREQSNAQIFRGTGNDTFEIDQLMASAQRRIWILGTNMSNTLIHHKRTLEQCCENRGDLDVKIIASHPESLFSLTRYHELPGKTLVAMRQEIEESNRDLYDLMDSIKRKNPTANFEIRLSLVQPTVSLIIIDDKIIASNFLQNTNSSHSARVLFESPDNNSMFVAHFFETWNRSEPYDKKLFYNTSKRLLSKNGNDIYEYTVTQKFSAWRKLWSDMGNALKVFFRFTGKHLVRIGVPLILLVISIAGLLALQFIDTSNIILYSNIRSATLGVFAGSLLSIMEYVFDNITTRKEYAELAAERAEHAAKTEQSLKKIFNEETSCHGVKIYRNRNDAKLHERITSAKKRVWIYATNHKYISEMDVATYLNEHKQLDVRFLMLDSNSMFIDTRWPDIAGKDSAAEFGQEIARQLKTLCSEYPTAKHVKLRTYVRQPNFMLFLIDDTLIVSPILIIQGRARDQEHFCFNMAYPSVAEIAGDFIKHFEAVWKEAPKLTPKNAEYKAAASQQLLTIEKNQQIKLTSKRIN